MEIDIGVQFGTDAIKCTSAATPSMNIKRTMK